MKITNEMILKVAMKQSSIDLNCNIEDFISTENVVVISKTNSNARKYLKLPHICNLVSYGNNIVASVSKEYEFIVKEYISKYSMEHCFETPNMHILNDAFLEKGYSVCFMAEYFLPDINILSILPCDYECRILKQKDFENLYTKQWSNALCKDRKHLDILGVGAYHNGKLVGLAACSADCESMWQIGVDVLPEYQRKGIGSAVTARLAIEILEQGKIPFYCCAWSNLKSVRNALKSGFRPGWIEMTIKPKSFVMEMNKKLL